MPRKFRSTEITGTVTIWQHMNSNWFCVNCHAIGPAETHYPDCKKPEAYTIPSSAEAPKKQAKKRVWEIFKKQFIYSQPVGYWHLYDRSWWFLNVHLPKLNAKRRSAGILK